MMIEAKDSRVMMLGPQKIKANSTFIFCTTVFERIRLDGLYVLPQLLDTFSFNDIKIGMTSLFYGDEEKRSVPNFSSPDFKKRMLELEMRTEEEKRKDWQEQIMKNRDMFSSHCKEDFIVIGKDCDVGKLIIVSVSNYSDKEETFHANLLAHVGES